MQSIKDVSNLILKGFGLMSQEVDDSNKFVPIIQQGLNDQSSSFYNIIEAIKIRDEVNILKYLSIENVSILFEVAPQSRDSLFHWGCLSGDVEILKVLKKFYDDSKEDKKILWVELINSKNSLEQSPLHWACTIENLSLIEFLTKEGADLNAIDSKGVTPLIMCCQYGNISCATYLILNGVDIMVCDKEGDNALHWALYKGYPELARLLIYSGLNPNQKDGFGQTPLHFACLSGNTNCVQNLVENDKVEINVYDNNNKTPIMLAAGRRQNKIVDYLKFHIQSRTFKLSIYSKIRQKIFGTTFNSYIPMIFFILCAMLWGNPYYYIVIRPCSINFAYFSNVLFVLIQSLMWICFIMASIKDPGFITKNDSSYNSIINEHQTLDYFKNIRIKDCYNSINKICHSCKSYKPIRARHCRTCDRCVNEMDHHCPYLGTCVGKNNRYWFFLFVVLLNFVTVIVSYLFYVAFSAETLSIYPAIITSILILIALFLGLTIFSFMFKQALLNLTLIESQKWRKYNYLQDEKGSFFNPNDKGYIKNILLFFNL